MNRILLYIDSDWNYIDIIISDKNFELLKELHIVNNDIFFDIFDEENLDKELERENLKYRISFIFDTLIDNGVDKIFIEKSLNTLPIPSHMYKSNHPFDIDKKWRIAYERNEKINKIIS